MAIQNRSQSAIAMSIAATAPTTTNDWPTWSPSRPMSRSRTSLVRDAPGFTMAMPISATIDATMAAPTVHNRVLAYGTSGSERPSARLAMTAT